MGRIQWTTENDRKLLLHLMKPAGDVEFAEVAAQFDGATPKAIEQRIHKLRRERKDVLSTLTTQRPSAKTASSTTNHTDAKANPTSAYPTNGKRKRARTSSSTAIDEENDSVTIVVVKTEHRDHDKPTLTASASISSSVDDEAADRQLKDENHKARVGIKGGRSNYRKPSIEDEIEIGQGEETGGRNGGDWGEGSDVEFVGALKKARKVKG